MKSTTQRLRPKHSHSRSKSGPFVPGSAPSNLSFSPDSNYLSYVTNERTLEALNLNDCLASAEYNTVRFFPDDVLRNSSSSSSINSNDGTDDENNEIALSEDDYESLSLVEKLRRERQRVSYSGNGIHSYQWSAERVLLVPQRECIYYTSDYTKYKLRCVYRSVDRDCLPMDVKLSPCGNCIGFVQRGNVYVLIRDFNSHLFHKRPIQLTFLREGEAVSYGTPDFLSMEEISRYEGYWFTSDGQGIVFTKVDETNVERYRIYYDSCDLGMKDNGSNTYTDVEIKDDINISSSCGDDQEDINEDRFEEHRYPFAGRANPITTLGFFNLQELYGTHDSGNEELDNKQRQSLAENIWVKRVIWQESPGA